MRLPDFLNGDENIRDGASVSRVSLPPVVGAGATAEKGPWLPGTHSL